MTNPDTALSEFREILKEFGDFCDAKGSASEADTRAKVIDRVLVQVLGWPESAISREDHVTRGYIDYTLTAGTRPHIAVEAKREGKAFNSPITSSKNLKLSGALLTDPDISEAVLQVRGYCDDAGIRYAIATNGRAWIVFRAIREDMPWREGQARVFASPAQIETRFTEFWNLLSYEAIQRGSLDEEFGSRIRPPRQLHRIVDRLFNSDLPLQRNRLHAQLHPLIQRIFLDIADQDPVEILQSCYVHTLSLRIVAQDLNTVITDSIPKFLRDQGAETVHQGEDDAGTFGEAVETALANRSGQLYLILGGIGSGKTTFIKRYQRTVGLDALKEHCLWFHFDFLEAPIDPALLESFVWKSILDQLRSRFAWTNLETRRNIKKAFADRLGVLSQTALRSTYLQPSGTYEAAISPYLERWQQDLADYVPRLLNLAWKNREFNVVLFIDNVDQLSPAYQGQVFVLAQRITRILGSVTVLALREESYYTANLQKTLTAYTSRKFHIASPQFRKMIHNRIRFALDILEAKGPVDYVFKGGISVDKTAIADFLRIIEGSIFEKNFNIARFIEALCFGNMRVAIDMFTMFMTSGATDVDKMLGIYRKSSQADISWLSMSS